MPHPEIKIGTTMKKLNAAKKIIAKEIESLEKVDQALDKAISDLAKLANKNGMSKKIRDVIEFGKKQ